MSRRRLFGSLLGLVFLANLARVVFAPLVEPLMATYGVGPGAAGLVATLAWLGNALPRIPVGYLLTRVPRHRVVLGSGALLVGATAVAALAPSIAVLGIGAFLMGTATGAYFIAANPLVSELYPERVGRAVGTQYAFSQVAAVLAAPFVGVVLYLGDFRLVFVGMCGAALLATAAFFLISRRADLPDAGAADRDLLGAARAQWRLVLAGVVVLGVAGFVWTGVFNFYVTYLKVAGLAEAAGRDLLTVVFAAGVPAIWVGGRLADRFPHVPLLLLILGSFAVTLVALTLAGGFLSLAAVSAALGLAIHSLLPVVDAYLLDTLPDEHRASAYSVYSGATMLVMAAGSAAVGALTEAGVAFGPLFRGFALVLGTVVGLLAGLYSLGRLP